MKRRFNLIPGLLLCTLAAISQSNLDQVLSSVQANNKTLVADQRRVEASKAFYKTGLSLPDPSLDFDWMAGVPSTAGNQTDLTLAQEFALPSVYKSRKEVAELKSGQIAFESELLRKNILLEAKLIGIRLIHLNKRKAELEKRLVNTERFFSNYQKKLEQQDATILDVNKARMQVLHIRTDLQLLEAEVAENLQQLTILNGGIPIVFADTVYPVEQPFPDFETLEQSIELVDPTLQYLVAQQEIGLAEEKLTKAMNLPTFEAGYRYQGLLGQQFHGVHTGVSVPLYENKKRKQYALLQTEFNDARVEEHRADHFNEIRKLYDQYHALKSDLEEYRANLPSAMSISLLDTSLQTGQMTTLEYFMETTLYYESVDRYLALEEVVRRLEAELRKMEL